MIVYVLFVHKKFKNKNKKPKKPKNIFSGFFRWVFWVGFLLPTLPAGRAGTASSHARTSADTDLDRKKIRFFMTEIGQRIKYYQYISVLLNLV